MTDTLPHIHQILESSGLAFEIMACDDSLTDTQAFCAHYGASLENSVNAIVLKSKRVPPEYAVCMVPALARLDVNGTARKKFGGGKVSFASSDETVAQTGMEIGGVTPLGLPSGIPVWVDSSIMTFDFVILGGGNRTSKIKVVPEILLNTPGLEVVTDLAKPA
ncbi:YbaK/EbsC family protein [Ensifer adhaerens]|uniref:YbaK/EbsC family protein n=1 Tax=Ensifer adhaerens TaxID=106592 RepID=UPI0009902551|nr:YbaK/EbsC family protein [Ensifer adhaerens]